MQCTNAVTSTNQNSQTVKLEVRVPSERRYYTLDRVRTDDNLHLPRHTVNASALKMKYHHLRDIPAGDLKDVKPMILIGQEYQHLTVARKIVEGSPNAPIATWSKLGWAIHGRSGLYRGRVDKEFTCHVYHNEEMEKIHQLVKESFRTENFGVKVNETSLLSKEEKRVKLITEATTKKTGDRWETGLLWKSDDIQLPDSLSVARRRLAQIERKLDDNVQLAKYYCDKIDHYIDKGYATKLSSTEAVRGGKRMWYLPHFVVFHPNKPDKPRIVFDAASKANGTSLNDALLKGMDLLRPLASVLFKFRQYEIGFCGDIREMFHQVEIRDEDKSSQRFIWRGMDRKKPPDVYRMNVMIFGAISSPYSAQEVKNRNADLFKEEFPEACKTIKEKHYMDDCLDSTSSPEEASRRILDVIEVHRRGGFEICNWVSNSKKVLDSLPENLVSEKQKDLTRDGDTICERVLGLKWNPNEDVFTFSTSFSKIDKEILDGERRPTKREVLKLTMSVFDPLGFLANFTVKARILLQDIWRSEIGWDDEISTDVHIKWDNWLEDLSKIDESKIPRCYGLGIPDATRIQLHVFCDASQKAFAAAGYFRVISGRGIETSLVFGKAKVAPLRPMSIPRLELQAALMGARLASSIQKDHDINIDETIFWSDSRTVLCWLRSDARKFKQFVSLRVGEIEELSDINQWRWLPTKENVADEATRDSAPLHFSIDSRWVRGPEFLRLEENCWPADSKECDTKGLGDEELETKREFCAATKIGDTDRLDPSRYSSWTKLTRVTAYVLRFSRRCQEKVRERKSKIKSKNVTKWLSLQEIREAQFYWLKRSQDECFPDEIKDLQTGGQVKKSSRLLKLSPVVNQAGLLTMKGRTEKSPDLNDGAKRPIILDPKHDITKLIVSHYHCIAGHQGKERVVNDLRQKYWIINMRAAANKSWTDCMQCRIKIAVPRPPEMAPLPEFRVTRQTRAFVIVGLDYFGPYNVTIGRRHEKRYGALFTCLTTRAVHVEIASSLSTDSVIMALRRFIARRGTPKEIHSDNGTNFRGAATELKKALKEMDQEIIQDEMTQREIVWHFIPPSAPFMGGAWERLVQSIKKALKAILTERSPKEETFTTFMAEAEFTVNSRPLTHVSVDPDDREALTPNHFLLGSSDGRPPPGNFDEKDLCLRKQWRISQTLSDMFWRRWLAEYLPSLNRREKWHQKTRQLKVGDLVFIADGDMIRNYWPRGIVTAVYPGKDAQVRVADVKTQSGTFRRPVAKLCILDLTKEVDVPAGSPTEGGMSLAGVESAGRTQRLAEKNVREQERSRGEGTDRDRRERDVRARGRQT